LFYLPLHPIGYLVCEAASTHTPGYLAYTRYELMERLANFTLRRYLKIRWRRGAPSWACFNILVLSRWTRTSKTY